MGPCTELVEAILASGVAPKRIQMPTISSESMARQIENCTSLEEFVLEFTPYGRFLNFSQHSQLRKLRFGLNSSSPSTDLGAIAALLPPMLGDLDLYTNSIDLKGIEMLQYMERLTIASSGDPITSAGPSIRLPPRLTFLNIDNLNVSEVNITSMDAPGQTGLQTLDISGVGNATVLQLPSSLLHLTWHHSMEKLAIVEFPPLLESIDLRAAQYQGELPPTLSNCTHLQSLSISLTGVTEIPSLVLTNLTYFRLVYALLNQTAMDRAACQLPSSLLTLTLSSPLSNPISVPQCIGTRYPNLQSLYLTNWKRIPEKNWPSALAAIPPSVQYLHLYGSTYRGPALDWELFFSKIPNVKRLYMSAMDLTGTFPPALTQSLETLDISLNQLTGTIPGGFFATHPQLTTLLASNNRFTGALPFYGWSRVVQVNLASNRFTQFPSINGGAKNLRTIQLALNDLRTIPDDATFNQMPQLAFLSLNMNVNLRGPVPQFFATHPSITVVHLAQTRLQGPLPSVLAAPNLRYLSISAPIGATSGVCGSLPEIGIEMVMDDLEISGGILTGTIPASWGQKLQMGWWHGLPAKVDLGFNRLSGTLPDPLVAPSSHLGRLVLNNNYFSGPLPSIPLQAGQTGLYDLNLANTGIDPCASNFNASYMTIGTCTMPYNGSTCACASEWPSSCTDAGACSPAESPPVAPPSAPPRTSCPIPAPRASAAPIPMIIISGTTTFEGQLSVNTTLSLVFEGLDSQLHVNGCISSIPQITINLDDHKLRKLTSKDGTFSFTAITSDGGLCDGVTVEQISATFSLVVNMKNAGCVRTTATPTVTPNGLVIFLVSDSTPCHTRWIITASVIGGVALISVIVGGVWFAMRTRRREQFRKALVRAQEQQ